MATSNYQTYLETAAGLKVTTGTVELQPYGSAYPTGKLALAHQGNGVWTRAAVPDGEYSLYYNGTVATNYQRFWVGENKISLFGSHFDEADGYKLKPTGLKAQTATVTSLTAPVPSYIGQFGEDASGNKYTAIALTGTMWEKIPSNLRVVSLEDNRFNRLIWKESGTTLTTDMILARKAIIDVKFYGSAVDTTKNYYLETLMYYRTTYLDVGFTIKNSDGTPVSFYQATTAGVTGVVTYTTNNISNFTGVVTIDWDVLTAGYSLGSVGTQATMSFANITKFILDKNNYNKKLMNVAESTTSTDAIPKSQIDTAIVGVDSLNLNSGNTYPIDPNAGTMPTGSDLTKMQGFLLDCKIFNANPDSYYRLYYVAKGQAAPYYDVMSIWEYSKTTSAKIREIIPLTSGFSITKLTVPQTFELSNETLKATLPNVNFQNGLKFIFTVDYSKISGNAIYLTGFDTRFSDLCVQSYYRIPYHGTTIPNLPKNLIWNEDDATVYIASKWDTASDLIIKFNKTYFNQLPSFSKVSLAANTSPIINSDITRTSVSTLVDADGQLKSDIIGPYKLASGQWVGGSHGYEGALATLTAAYTYGDTELHLDDVSSFVATGSWFRSTVNAGFFTYTGVDVGNSKLTGVSQPVGSSNNITNGTTVYLFHPTATNVLFEIYADGKLTPLQQIVEANELQIVVRNAIYDPATLDLADGSMDIGFYENVYYTVSEGNIEVMVEQDFVRAMDISYYYGMQMLNATWMDKVYLAHSQNTAIQNKTAYPNSGAYPSYPCEKLIISKSDFTINCAMFFDETCGYATNRVSYLDNTDFLFESNSNNKIYHYNIAKSSVSFDVAQKEWWRGVYSFFKNPTLVDASYAYKMKLKGADHIAFDFHAAGKEDINIPNYHSTDAEEISKDTTLTVDTEIKPLGLNVVATDYGNGLFKLNK